MIGRAAFTSTHPILQYFIKTATRKIINQPNKITPKLTNPSRACLICIDLIGSDFDLINACTKCTKKPIRFFVPKRSIVFRVIEFPKPQGRRNRYYQTGYPIEPFSHFFAPQIHQLDFEVTIFFPNNSGHFIQRCVSSRLGTDHTINSSWKT